MGAESGGLCRRFLLPLHPPWIAVLMSLAFSRRQIWRGRFWIFLFFTVTPLTIPFSSFDAASALELCYIHIIGDYPCKKVCSMLRRCHGRQLPLHMTTQPNTAHHTKYAILHALARGQLTLHRGRERSGTIVLPGRLRETLLRDKCHVIPLM